MEGMTGLLLPVCLPGNTSHGVLLNVLPSFHCGRQQGNCAGGETDGTHQHFQVDLQLMRYVVVVPPAGSPVKQWLDRHFQDHARQRSLLLTLKEKKFTD